jgi:hypothetical protein
MQPRSPHENGDGRRRHRTLRWPQEEAVTEVFERHAQFKDGALGLTPGAAFVAAGSLWDTPPPRNSLLRALRAVALPSLDRVAFTKVLRHVVVSFEVVATIEKSASAAWSIVEADDDCRLTLQEFARAAKELKCDCPGTADSAAAVQPYLDRCAAVFARMASYDGGFVLLEELVEWIAPQRARNRSAKSVGTRPAKKSPRPQAMGADGVHTQFISTGNAAKTHQRQQQQTEAAALTIQKSWRASVDRARLVRSWSLEAAMLRSELGMLQTDPLPHLASESADAHQIVAEEIAAVRIQAVYRGSAARKPPAFPDESDDSLTDTDSDADSFSPPPSETMQEDASDPGVIKFARYGTQQSR